MTLLDLPVKTGERQSSRTASMLVAGVLGGLAIGIVARGWMRFISEEPEFTWAGTLGIIGGFTLFGLTQSIVATARRAEMRRRYLTAFRLLGIVGMVPLFGAAGAIMFPTVVGAGLGLHRSNWHRSARTLCLLIATGPVLFVGRDLVESFGWSVRTAGGLAVMLGIYAVIIGATQYTFAPQPDGWTMPSWARILLPLAVCVLMGVPLYIGGIAK